ncbi:MAG: hypothetical protein IJY69_04740 [Clostridia bacterium]|nr:hypothetical protein [Clostridia bacterium]
MNIKPGAAFSIEKMKKPPVECDVTYAWLWNEPITKEGIDERLKDFVTAGIKSLYILPMPKDFGSETLRTFMDPEYLTDEFWELIRYALSKCVELGIKPWIYDEGGWPSGGACANTLRQNSKAKLKFLRKEEVKLIADKRYYPTSDGFVALYKGKKRVPDDYITSIDCTLTAYYVEERVLRNCRVDYTNASVTDTFINNTYEAYKRNVGEMFGDTIPLFFTDEPGLMRDSIADNEFDLFIKEYGYDLRDYLYVIENNGSYAVTEKDKQARIDHLRMLGKLFRENTFNKLHDWCEKNGVYYSGHLDIDNRPYGGTVKGYFSLIDALRQFHIPGIDVIWEQIRYPYGDRAPVDDETLGMAFFPRLASSAARQEKRNLALTETFSIYGDALTPDEMRYIANFQAIRGINVFNFLTLPYGKKRCSALMMRPAFCPEKPGFFNLKHVNEYYARLSYLTRLGYAEGDTALYLPCYDFAASPDDLDDASYLFKKLGTSLEERNIAFDIIDEQGIRDAVQEKDGLRLGDALYRHIAVPQSRYMPEDVREKIAPYLTEGEPTYTFTNKKLRVMTRKLDTGRLWFIFNEGEAVTKEKMDIDGKHIYSIDLSSGRIKRLSVPEVELLAGEIAVLLATDEVYECDSDELDYSIELGGFKAEFYERFTVDYTGIRKDTHVGEVAIDDGFSGTVHFSAEYELNSTPSEKDTYRIRLEDTSVSATVMLDGEYLCDVGMSPMLAYLPLGALKKSGKITVAVSNTAANEIIEKKSVYTSLPEAEVGAYIPRLTKFEIRRPMLKLGKVFLEKLK